MSSTVRRHRRERKRRRRGEMINCHTCGREGPRWSMVHRNEQWTCRRIQLCMDRVLLPQPPVCPDVTLREYTIADVLAMHNVTFAYAGTTTAPLPYSASAAEFAAGFKPMGYISDEGI